MGSGSNRGKDSRLRSALDGSGRFFARDSTLSGRRSAAEPLVILEPRRRLLRTALGAAILGLTAGTTGCERLLRALAESCPDDPAESGGVDWTPDVLHPVFYGYQDVGTGDGAPGPIRIWYPTYEGFTAGPPVLKLCLVRWPLVLLLHGQPPCPDADYHKRWHMLPAVLARAGYVVAVPGYAAALAAERGSANERYALDVIDWMRDGWTERRWLDARATSTGVVGHSYGALLAARVAQARPTISAYVGLSGPWTELGNPIPLLQAIGAPAFFMWTTGNPIVGALESLDGGGLWNQVPAPKHAALLPAEHFDYLRPWSGCSFVRGDCTLTEAVSAELAALFLARRLPIGTSSPPIPVSLEVPAVSLTAQQQFFAGGHLSGLQQIATRNHCRVELRWQEGAASGWRQLGL